MTIRTYPSIAKIAASVVRAYQSKSEHKAGLEAATAALSAYMLTDRKIARLTEQLKDAVVDGGLDDVTEIRELFRAIYRRSTLKGVDEEGRPLAM